MKQLKTIAKNMLKLFPPVRRYLNHVGELQQQLAEQQALIDGFMMQRQKDAALPAGFNSGEYLLLNPDIQRAGVNLVEHYLSSGSKEGRQYCVERGGLFSSSAGIYAFDGLSSIHNHDFMVSQFFKDAYARGVLAADGVDYQWYWRVHIGLWAAQSAARVAGDFVECGVNRGFLSSAIMHALNWNNIGRVFYLLDTFEGLDERFVSDQEKKDGVLQRNKRELETGFYTTDVKTVRDNFSEWRNTQIVVGTIPETLDAIKSEQIAFLHLDLNNSPPEVAAIEALWDRIPSGGMVLLDDYAYYGYQLQKEGMDAWASKRDDVPIASLPTGQGLIVKV